MKRLLLNILFLLTLLTASAQTTPLRFNVHVDPQSAWFNSDENEIDPNGAIIHINAGLNMDYYFAKNYAFVLGFGINNIGGKLLYADSTIFLSKGDTLLLEPNQSAKLNLQYIDIPIGLKLKTEEMGYATYFLQLGFNPMFRLNSKLTSDEASFDKEDISESVILFNLGYHVGIGVEYKLGGSTALIGGLRWTGGLTDVTDNDRANVRTNALSIHLGILF